MLDCANELHVLGIAGSLRDRSSSQFALEYAMGLLRTLGCHTRVFNLQTADLPFCSGNPDEQARDCPGLVALRTAVSKAHAVVLVTPEYHGSMSGVLKNALDLLDTRHLAGKVAGLISVLGGQASSNALHDLSRVLRSCHAWVLPQYIAIGQASTVISEGKVSDFNLRMRFDEFAENLAESAARLSGLKQGRSEELAHLFALAGSGNG
jgi:FMN reductase